MIYVWIALGWLAAAVIAAPVIGLALRAADERSQAAARGSHRAAVRTPADPRRAPRPPGPIAAVGLAVALVVVAGLAVGGVPILDWAYTLAGAR